MVLDISLLNVELLKHHAILDLLVSYPLVQKVQKQAQNCTVLLCFKGYSTSKTLNFSSNLKSTAVFQILVYLSL